MFSRILGVPVLLAAAVGVPYLASQGVQFDQFWKSSGADTDSEGSAAAEATPVELPEAARNRWELPPQGPGAEIFPNHTPLEGAPSLSLHEVFRFDITKDWVYQRWARKSTALAELGLYGVRVPLVTGTQLHDLAGSLTYFFDQPGTLQRISFRGNTGDTTQLVALVTQRYGLQWQPTAIVGEQLLQVRQGGDVFSELRTRPAAVLWSSSPHNSFSVELQLQRPGSTVPLPARAPALPDVTAQHPAAPGTDNQPSEANESKKDDEDGKENLDLFFPRSRLPSQQVNGLDKRNRY